MRTFPLVGLLMAALLASPGPAQAGDEPARFASVIDDLPLMAHITEVGEGVEFSTPDGRIAEVSAQGPVTRQAVLAFYTATLPQLGWSRIDETVFVREDETLTLIMNPVKGGLRVRFALAPYKK